MIWRVLSTTLLGKTSPDNFPFQFHSLTFLRNQCIAETVNRFPVDMYHINDYHGACAPLYLLPRVIPVALSLHNAEFQGMWPMRTPEESKEVCEVYNLSEEIVKEYVQFGSGKSSDDLTPFPEHTGTNS